MLRFDTGRKHQAARTRMTLLSIAHDNCICLTVAVGAPPTGSACLSPAICTNRRKKLANAAQNSSGWFTCCAPIGAQDIFGWFTCSIFIGSGTFLGFGFVRLKGRGTVKGFCSTSARPIFAFDSSQACKYRACLRYHRRRTTSWCRRSSVSVFLDA